jgi:hypothetical protein
MQFFRQRRVWVPTVWGVLALCAIAAGATLLFVRQAFDVMALNEAAAGPGGSGARTLVIEGWLEPPELEQAVAAFRRGRYERVLTTGGPIEPWFDAGGWKTFAARTERVVRALGLVEVPVIALPVSESRRDRTYLDARTVGDWAQRTGTSLGAIDLYSSGVHARRSRLLYRMALGRDVEVGVIAAQPSSYDARNWWTSSTGVKATMGEILSYGWTVCCFWPDPPPPSPASAPPLAP